MKKRERYDYTTRHLGRMKQRKKQETKRPEKKMKKGRRRNTLGQKLESREGA
jgi:hypothetical protein